MKSINSVNLLGNLGGDPEIKDCNGKTITKFSVATNEVWLDKNTNERRESIEWHKVVCFHKLAEVARKHLRKGAKVHISGKLKTTLWQDKNNENHHTTEIIMDNLIMLDSKPSQFDGNR